MHSKHLYAPIPLARTAKALLLATLPSLDCEAGQDTPPEEPVIFEADLLAEGLDLT